MAVYRPGHKPRSPVIQRWHNPLTLKSIARLNSLRPSDAYVSVKHTNIASDNGLSPIWRQAIISTNAAILSIRPQGTYFSEILSKIWKFLFKKMHLKMSSAKWRPFCLGLNVLNDHKASQEKIYHPCLQDILKKVFTFSALPFLLSWAALFIPTSLFTSVCCWTFYSLTMFGLRLYCKV